MPFFNGKVGLSSNENFFRLPVDGRVVCVGSFRGAEDLLLAESAASDTILAMRLADRLTRDTQGARVDWGNVAITDLDAFVIFLRRMLIGDGIRSDATCVAKGCGQRIDIAFGVGQFLEHHAPRVPVKSYRGWSVQPSEEPRWYRLDPPGRTPKPSVATLEFRVPTPSDQLALSGRPDGDAELARRCLRPANASVKARRTAEAVMEIIAPSLSCDIKAVCPECGISFALFFEARRFCLSELRDSAVSVYADVDVLAQRYHWSERQILSLPRTRRVAYVEQALQAQSR